MFDPFVMTRVQRIALWDVADATKKYFHFLQQYQLTGSGRFQMRAALLEVGQRLDELNMYRPENPKMKFTISIGVGSRMISETFDFDAAKVLFTNTYEGDKEELLQQFTDWVRSFELWADELHLLRKTHFITSWLETFLKSEDCPVSFRRAAPSDMRVVLVHHHEEA